MNERNLILEAMENGMDIINGLHQFFSEDREFVHMAARNDIQIKDIRKPPQLKDLHVFTGQRSKVSSCNRRIRYRLCLRKKDYRGRTQQHFE